MCPAAHKVSAGGYKTTGNQAFRHSNYAKQKEDCAADQFFSSLLEQIELGEYEIATSKNSFCVFRSG